MTDDEIQQRNRQLAAWTTCIDSAMSLMVDGSTATAYEVLNGVRNEMQAMAMGEDDLAWLARVRNGLAETESQAAQR